MPKVPARWGEAEPAIKAVQVAFDVEEAVLRAVRYAAYRNELSPSDQIRQVLNLPVSTRPKRPRLTVSLAEADYHALGARFGLAAEDRLAIKERVTAELIAFAQRHPPPP
ncbi:hypothetical protein [Chitinimonas sp. JJ19]|uniref:hypothetical protein n=1 Tax=Chitinimonas sp. JJ19 TaxID=3109352 RepID=UPI001A3F3511|nr:hypothetical protein [Chitinimonas sp.]